MKKSLGLTIVSLVITILVSISLADKLTLKNGTVLEGRVIKNGNDYWVKTADGTSQVIAGDDVASVEKTGDSSSGASVSENASNDFRSASRRAAEVESALAAVAIWQEFIDRHDGSAEIPDAKTQLDHWQTMAKEGAEKINGKWVSGDEREKILSQANDLIRQGDELLEHGQSLKAIEKFQQSVKIYPNSFSANLFMGNINLMSKNYPDAMHYYATALHLDPQSAETVNNMAVANVFQRHYEDAILGFQHAAELQDNPKIIQNLINALADAPPSLRGQSSLKKANQAANLLGNAYKLDKPTDTYAVLRPEPKSASNHNGSAPGQMWCGTGFLISDDGLILTNRHVAADAKTLLVMIGDKQTTATVVVIDDEQDLALIKINIKAKTPFLHFAKTDMPKEGADCVVMGFPLIDRLGADIKITRGIVSGVQDQDLGANLLTDAKVNPGNSGGPILDKNGNVMAIVCMKSISSSTEDSYGIGISAGHIRKFLMKNKLSVTPGSDSAAQMATEDIAAMVKPATVCILATK